MKNLTETTLGSRIGEVITSPEEHANNTRLRHVARRQGWRQVDMLVVNPDLPDDKYVASLGNIILGGVFDVIISPEATSGLARVVLRAAAYAAREREEGIRVLTPDKHGSWTPILGAGTALLDTAGEDGVHADTAYTLRIAHWDLGYSATYTIHPGMETAVIVNPETYATI